MIELVSSQICDKCELSFDISITSTKSIRIVKRFFFIFSFLIEKEKITIFLCWKISVLFLFLIEKSEITIFLYWKVSILKKSRVFSSSRIFKKAKQKSRSIYRQKMRFRSSYHLSRCLETLDFSQFNHDVFTRWLQQYLSSKFRISFLSSRQYWRNSAIFQHSRYCSSLEYDSNYENQRNSSQYWWSRRYDSNSHLSQYSRSRRYDSDFRFSFEYFSSS